jgi:pseudouridine synthase
LILLTNDGDLANKLSHPKFGVEKTYIAKIVGIADETLLHKLNSGFDLEDGFIKADRAKIIDASKGHSLIEIVLHSGRNRIVRRMFEHIGYPVVDLVRKQFGPIHLGGLKLGHVRQLSKLEIGALLKFAEGAKARAPRPKDKTQAKKRR